MTSRKTDLRSLAASLAICAAGMFSTGLLPGGATTAMAQTKIKWAHVYEVNEPYHKQSVWAAEEIKKRSNGKFDIQVFPASSLGKETDINQGLTLGTVDMIISGPSFAARTYPRVGIAYYPFIFRDGDHLLAYAKSDLFKEMAEEYRKKTGIAMLAYTYYGARHTTSNRAFKDCAGMKGLKIRVPDVAAYMATPKSCGANPTPIAFAEVYLALQNGTVEAQENPLPTIEAKKFYEVQKHIMLTGHIVDGLVTQVAPHVWNKLSADEKKIFTEVAQEAASRASADIKKREGELVEFFRKAGLTVNEIDRNSFQQAVLKNAPLESMGFTKADYDRIQAVK
jgi:tripartite ATP-independent transporter DctP family solute receptor